MALIRIDKYLSVACGISRAEAKALIKSGNITANGVKITKADQKVDELDEIKNLNRNLIFKKHIYIIMNKPEGILSASSDKRVKTVVDILPEHLKREGLFPVGRLDKNTTGLLIITNDGDFGHRVISPKSNIEKRYYACLDGEVKEEYKYVFQKGVTLASGEVCMPAKLEIEDSRSAYVTIREGKYHQIKRMFGVVGLGVDRLHRVSIGDLTLPCDLDVGQARELNEEELNKIIPKYR
jgi:16S rRNA pseudouridine516 synthase